MEEWKRFIEEVSRHLSTAKVSDDQQLCKKVLALVQQLKPEEKTQDRYFVM